MKRMVYIVIAVAGFLVAGAIVAGCSIKPVDNNTTEINGISLSQSHMEFNHCYSFYLRDDDGKVIFDAEVRIKEEPYQIIIESCEVDSSYMNKVIELCNKKGIVSFVSNHRKKLTPFVAKDKTVNTTTLYFQDHTEKSAETSSEYKEDLYNFFKELAQKYYNRSVTKSQ